MYLGEKCMLPPLCMLARTSRQTVRCFPRQVPRCLCPHFDVDQKISDGLPLGDGDGATAWIMREGQGRIEYGSLDPDTHCSYEHCCGCQLALSWGGQYQPEISKECSTMGAPVPGAQRTFSTGTRRFVYCVFSVIRNVEERTKLLP
jgi:hypothetical protein